MIYRTELYEVGDVVKIWPWKIWREIIPQGDIDHGMEQFAGRVATITAKNYEAYEIDIDTENSTWWWDEDFDDHKDMTQTVHDVLREQLCIK